MKALSVFSGVGGFEQGFDGLVDLVAVSEIDKHANRVLAARFPGVPNLGDLAAVPDDDLPEHDLLMGGFPCQGVSQANVKREGLRDARSGLWWEFVRVASVRSPRWLLVENVRGLLSSNGGRDMATVVGTMGELGYSVSWRVLDARYFGVPQRRRRLFLVGHLGSVACAGAVLHEPEGGPRDPRASAAPRGEDGSTPQTGVGSRGGRAVRRKSRRAQSADDYETWVPEEFANTLNRYENTDVRATNLVIEAFPDPAGTLTKRYAKGVNTTFDDGAVIVEKGERLRVRRLTPNECERLQGFPTGWGDIAPAGARYGFMGNAVAVPVIRWIARRMVAIDEWCQGTLDARSAR